MAGLDPFFPLPLWERVVRACEASENRVRGKAIGLGEVIVLAPLADPSPDRSLTLAITLSHKGRGEE
jgi:hypothetical protein